jgi:transcription-repair coupling factor (superfamily II helicase)
LIQPDYSPAPGAALKKILPELARGNPLIELYGLSSPAAAFALSRLWSELKRPILVVTPAGAQQEVFYRDLAFFLGVSPDVGGVGAQASLSLLSFPAHEKVSFKELTADTQISCARIETAYPLLVKGGANIVVATVLSVLQPLPPRERLGGAVDYVVQGEELERNRFIRQLEEGGYERRSLVEERGDYSVRGGILDFYPPLYRSPVRLEFWGDEVESIRFFDPVNQRSQGALAEVVVLPVNEVILDQQALKYASHKLRSVKDPKIQEYLQQGRHFPQMERYLDYFYSQTETLWDYLPATTLLVEWDPFNLTQETRSILETQAAESEEEGGLAFDVFKTRRERFQTIVCHNLSVGSPFPAEGRHFTFDLEQNQDLGKSLPTSTTEPGGLIRPLARRLRQWLESGFQVVFVCRSRSQAERLWSLLADQEVQAELTDKPQWDFPGQLQLTWNGLSAGFRWLAQGLVIITEEEVLGATRERPRKKGSRPLQFFTSLTELKVGDAVVHMDHGIGCYRDLVKLTVGDEVNDFLQLEYLGGDKLYLPVDRLHLVQKYMGLEGQSPNLDKLGGKSWEKAKKRVRKAVEKIARELVELYAARQVLQGYQFSPPDPALREFEATFEYEETPDQLQAIVDVAEDMAGEKPMDRLVCGDVGYGKTEVALRAAFKAAMDGKQVAFLVPTTVLAEQHYTTFQKRFRPYPVEIRVLSRFKAPAERKKILVELAAGKVDIIIGTHRLLQKDVQFRDLGLLIIDEEQRFGVSQKEKFKQLRRNVDVLALTATPIPRTLQLSLTGIRDLSIIDTAPEARQAIRTFLCRPEDKVISEAIRRELRRGGQTFFVHNRVKNLAVWANYIHRLVPEARLATAHGQMPEGELEEVMWKFWRGEVDVLVCTAIIEAGLDIPRANTIIINRAHTFGLSQVYQLRGRVGRSQEQAYAYLLVPDEEVLKTEAQKRLKALMEFTELGSGFKIALHDLQIRGSGNMLGAAQSGHIAEVGYEMYLQLLEQAVQELKGIPTDEGLEPELHLPLAAYLPETYVPDIDQRLVLYRRLSGRLDLADIDAMAEELRDCYGQLPEEGKNLLEVARIKNRLREMRIKRLDLRDNLIILTFADDRYINQARLVELLQRQPRRFRLTPEKQLRIYLQDDGGPVERVKKYLKEIEIFVIGGKIDKAEKTIKPLTRERPDAIH